MRSGALHFSVSLRAGFFKAQPYTVAASFSGMDFQPLPDTEDAAFFIPLEEVQIVYMIKGESAELEIVTAGRTYVCILHKTADISGIAQHLTVLLGKKFIFMAL